ncbi:hypothetical protein FOL46_003518 [Perkinsus olseni]|uniref:Uncharacterized protein n=1 Tax=Perkinsus olseni TaxID=32597 RepID=A0A7J6M284_PEROL|nr:hypothetical protein FOL46_003518 [Perkinsus olseni]
MAAPPFPRGSRSESFPEFRLRQQTSWRLLRESVGDSDYRRRQAAWGKSLKCLAEEFEGKSILRNSSVEKLPVAPVGGFSRMPTATSLSPTVEGEAQQQGHKKARREAITPSLEPPVGGIEAGHYASQSISSMLAESPREGGSLQVLARLQLKASAKTREACTAKMCESRPDTQKAEKMVRKKILEESKGLDFIFSRNRDRVLAAARPFTTSFALNQKQRRRVEAQEMSLTAPGGWPSMSDGGVNEQPGGVKKEKFIVKINKRDKWQRDVLWRKIFAHIDEATSAAAEPSASKNHLPAAHAVHREEVHLPRHSAESLAALRQLPRSRSLLPPRTRARVEDDEKWQAMKMLYYGGLDGDVVEHLDIIRECKLGLQDGKGSILERLEIYPMLQVPEETNDHIRTIGITFTKRHRAPHAADVVAELDVVTGTRTPRHYHRGVLTVTMDEAGQLSFEDAEPDGFDEFFKLVYGEYDVDTPTVTVEADGLLIDHGYKFMFIPYESATAAEDAYDHDWLSGCP